MKDDANAESIGGAAVPEAEQVAEEIEEIEVKGSSRNLALASRMFRVMFDGEFQEKVTSGQTELGRIPLPEDKLHVMMILLRTRHGQNGKVPDAVNREFVVEIVALLANYELLDASRMHADVWTFGPYKIESMPWPELVDRIYITWAFQTTRLSGNSPSSRLRIGCLLEGCECVSSIFDQQ